MNHTRSSRALMIQRKDTARLASAAPSVVVSVCVVADIKIRESVSSASPPERRHRRGGAYIIRKTTGAARRILARRRERAGARGQTADGRGREQVKPLSLLSCRLP